MIDLAQKSATRSGVSKWLLTYAKQSTDSTIQTPTC